MPPCTRRSIAVSAALWRAGVMPDVLLIDGGAGQVAQARAALDDLGVEGVALVGVAKGPARRPGDESCCCPTDASCIRARNRRHCSWSSRFVTKRTVSPSPATAAAARRHAAPAGSRTFRASARAAARRCSSILAAWAGSRPRESRKSRGWRG
jgi:hypothetical protein